MTFADLDSKVTLVISDTYGAEAAIDPPGPIHHLDHTVGEGLEEVDTPPGYCSLSRSPTRLEQALVFLYTPDNQAPPNASEVAHYWQATQYQFPGAV